MLTGPCFDFIMLSNIKVPSFLLYSLWRGTLLKITIESTAYVAPLPFIGHYPRSCACVWWLVNLHSQIAEVMLAVERKAVYHTFFVQTIVLDSYRLLSLQAHCETRKFTRIRILRFEYLLFTYSFSLIGEN